VNGRADEREVARQMALLELSERHPYSRYRCDEPGCDVIYQHPRTLGPLGQPWRCADHDPHDPRRSTR
jgi:hypothetical protein